MKILHLSSEKTWRGGEQQIAYLILESLLKGIQTHVICRKGTEFETWCKKNNIQHLSVSFANELDLISVFKIKKYCVTHRIDIMHAHSSHSHALGLFSKLFGNPAHFIVSRRVDFPIRDNWFSKYKFNHSSVLKYVCVSKAIEIILSKDLLNPEKSVTIHSGIDTQKFEGVINKHTLRTEFNIPASILLSL